MRQADRVVAFHAVSSTKVKDNLSIVHPGFRKSEPIVVIFRNSRN